MLSLYKIKPYIVNLLILSSNDIISTHNMSNFINIERI